MDLYLTEPVGPFHTAAGAAFNTFTTKKDVSPQPLPVIRIDRADRNVDLLGHLEDGSGELRPRVAVVMPVEEGGPAAEEVADTSSELPIIDAVDKSSLQGTSPPPTPASPCRRT